MRTFIRGGRVITPAHTIDDAIVIIEDGKVMAIEPCQQVTSQPFETEVIDAAGLLVLPGLIDLHVHGSAGGDTMDATPQALAKISDFLLHHGVTSYLATTITSQGESINRALENFSQCGSLEGGAQPLGVHMEGPYLNREYRGAQPLEWLRDPDPAQYHRWLDTGVVRSITLAPERPGALEFIREGARRGVFFSAGHSAATFDQMQQAIDAGLCMTTHTFNGMAGLNHREPGVLGAALIDERVTCEVIADGIHIHPAMLRLLVRTKGAERVVLVTDAMRAAGLPDGEYDLAGQTVHVREGVARTAAGGLAGSTLTLNRAVRNMHQLAGVPLHQAVGMATANPAAVLGVSGRKGVIQAGADADIILVDSDLNLKIALLGGKRVINS